MAIINERTFYTFIGILYASEDIGQAGLSHSVIAQQNDAVEEVRAGAVRILGAGGPMAARVDSPIAGMIGGGLAERRVVGLGRRISVPGPALVGRGDWRTGPSP